jgi:hypothetical protein
MCTVNLFDIPKGASVQKAGGVEYPDITQVTAASGFSSGPMKTVRYE